MIWFCRFYHHLEYLKKVTKLLINWLHFEDYPVRGKSCLWQKPGDMEIKVERQQEVQTSRVLQFNLWVPGGSFVKLWAEPVEMVKSQLWNLAGHWVDWDVKNYHSEGRFSLSRAWTWTNAKPTGFCQQRQILLAA